MPKPTETLTVAWRPSETKPLFYVIEEIRRDGKPYAKRRFPSWCLVYTKKRLVRMALKHLQERFPRRRMRVTPVYGAPTITRKEI